MAMARLAAQLPPSAVTTRILEQALAPPCRPHHLTHTDRPTLLLLR